MKDIHVVGKKMTRNDSKIAKCKGCDIWMWTDYTRDVVEIRFSRGYDNFCHWEEHILSI